MSVCLLSVCYVLPMHASLWRQDKNVRLPRTEVPGSCELLHGCWEPRLEPLQRATSILNS